MVIIDQLVRSDKVGRQAMNDQRRKKGVAECSVSPSLICVIYARIRQYVLVSRLLYFLYNVLALLPFSMAFLPKAT